MTKPDPAFEHWQEHHLPWLLIILNRSEDPKRQALALECAWVQGRYDYMEAARGKTLDVEAKG